jgi:polyisoprenoid-binding protein YceI
MRDTHMRERIFTDANGKESDVEFRSTSEIQCANAVECEVSGILKIQGKEQPLTLKTKLDLQNGKLKSEGKAEILLSKYGIALPEHLGVKVQEPVLIEFEAESK